MKKIVFNVLIASVLLLGLSACENKEKIKERIAQEAALLHRSREAEPVPVKVLTVMAEEVFSSTNYVGRVEPSKSALVLGQFPGTLTELYARKGMRVSKGTVLAVINSESVKSAYDMAKSTLEQAEDGYARVEQVYASGSVTEVKMVEIRTQLEKARAAEKAARQALEDCTVKAPFSGVIGEVYCQKGEQISAAAAMFQILDVESIEIHFNVPEREYAHIQTGAKAEVEVPALEKTVTGTVAVKGISASAISHSYDFTLKGITESSSLMPGMVCKVRVQSEDGIMQTVIPASAVMTDMNGRYVWGVDEENRVCKTYVTVAGYADKGVIVTEGVSDGDRIIMEGSRKVSTGMKVKAEE